jgi:hypothetical protein
MLLGDGGRVYYLAGGLPGLVESIDSNIGMADTLNGGGGYNVLVAGEGDDLLFGSLTFDVMAGDFAGVTFDLNGYVVEVLRFGGQGDLIAQAQDMIFLTVGSDAQGEEQSGVVVPVQILIGDAASNARRLYVIASEVSTLLPTIAGFQFGETPRHSGASTPPQASDQPGQGQQGSQPPAGQSGEQQGPQSQPQEEQPGQQGAPQGEGTENPGGQPSGARPVSDAMVRVDWTVVPAEPAVVQEEQPAAGLALAGLLGAQALGQGVKGTWASADGRVMLDRRTRARAQAAAPRLAKGAIEATARHWLDGTQGMPAAVEAKDVRQAAKPAPRIDWLAGREPGAKGD